MDKLQTDIRELYRVWEEGKTQEMTETSEGIREKIETIELEVEEMEVEVMDEEKVEDISYDDLNRKI